MVYCAVLSNFLSHEIPGDKTNCWHLLQLGYFDLLFKITRFILPQTVRDVCTVLNTILVFRLFCASFDPASLASISLPAISIVLARTTLLFVQLNLKICFACQTFGSRMFVIFLIALWQSSMSSVCTYPSCGVCHTPHLSLESRSVL